MATVIKKPFVLDVERSGILQVNYLPGFQRLEVERADIPALIAALNMWQAGGFDPVPDHIEEERITPWREGLYFRSDSKYTWIADLGKLDMQVTPSIGEKIRIHNPNGSVITYFVEDIEYWAYTNQPNFKSHMRIIVLPADD